MDRSPNQGSPVNPLSKFMGLENSLLGGLASAIPKEKEAVAPSRLAESYWYNMTGFALRPSQVVKSTLHLISFQSPPLPFVDVLLVRI